MFRPDLGRGRSSFTRRLTGLNGFALVLVLSFPTVIEATTSADVLRAVSDLTAEVRLLHDANFTAAPGKKVSRSQTLHPRHVLQMTRTVQQKANTLAMLNGADIVAVGPMPTRKVKSADVMARIDAVAWVIDGMKPIFGVKAMIKPAPKREDATPNDVYSALHQLSQMIDGLGNPRTVPNDIYKIVDSIVFELEILARHYLKPHQVGDQDITGHNGAWNADLRPERKTKTLRTIYNRTFALAEALDRLIASRPELAPNGGVLRPYRRRGIINADHVSYALNDVLADVVAMKATTGDLTLAQSKRLASGMTPDHVNSRLQDALRIVEMLTDEG